MKEILKSKLKEVTNELRKLLTNDVISETQKDFLIGEMAILIELLENIEDGIK